MHIFLSVGEPSGDLHASKLIDELRSRVPGLRCSGFGGPLMQAAGCRIHYRLTDLAVMGIVDVIPLLWRFLRLIWSAGRQMDADRPDAVVLVDYPGFNWWIARLARRRKIPVFYYLPPQLWAWAPWRIRKMRRLVDEVLCCLPFEEEWYHRRGMAVRCVGHPFFDEVSQRTLDAKFLESQRSRSDSGEVVVGILPGSRNHEVELNFGVQLQVMEDLRRQIPKVRFLVASFRDSQREKCERKLAERQLRLPVEFHVGKTSEIIALSQACLMVSGSVSLELLARGKPAVVIYRAGPFHYWLGRLLITCPFITLPNLIAGKVVMPEFVLLGDARAEVNEIARILVRWLRDPAARQVTLDDLKLLQRQVAAPGATARAADAILERLSSCRPSHARSAAA